MAGRPGGSYRSDGGGSYRSEAGGPPSAEVALDIIDEHREPQGEDDPYGDPRWREDEETGSMGRPAQVGLKVFFCVSSFSL